MSCNIYREKLKSLLSGLGCELTDRMLDLSTPEQLWRVGNDFNEQIKKFKKNKTTTYTGNFEEIYISFMNKASAGNNFPDADGNREKRVKKLLHSMCLNFKV